MISHAVKNSHCSFCGAYFINPAPPKICVVCKNETYINPPPVSVSLIRVSVNDKIGIIVIQRSIPPQTGEWALPGGYIVIEESWREGAAREIREEVGVSIDPNEFSQYGFESSSNNKNLLFFNTVSRVIKLEEINFTQNREVSNFDICFMPVELAFPSHTKYMKVYMESLGLK